MDEDVKKLMEIKYTSTLATHDKAVWNEAIEAAAKLTHNRGSNQCMRAAIEIRKLRK